MLIPEFEFHAPTGTLLGYNLNIDFTDVSDEELYDEEAVYVESDEEEDNYNPNIDG